MNGRQVIVNAIESTKPIASVKEVPLAYLESISNYWQNLSIGSGGFASVYKGIDMEANLIVAIKVLCSDTLNEKHKKDFKTEIENLSKLCHPPNIVSILERVAMTISFVWYWSTLIEGHYIRFSHHPSVAERSLHLLGSTSHKAFSRRWSICTITKSFIVTSNQ